MLMARAQERMTQNGRDDDLGDQALPQDRRAARGGQRRADHAADERVRGTRRDAEEPGDEVPDDAADQAGRHHGQPDVRGIDQTVCDRGRDGQREERPNQVKQA
jgi:hypothetical protein